MADKKSIILNDDTVNNLGFIVHTAGIDLSRFLKNPVMLHNHNSDKLIGSITDLTVEEILLTGVPVFNSKNEFAAEKQQEFEDGFLKASSLGLCPPFTFSRGSEMDAELGYDDDDFVLASCVLAEVSLTPVPQNQNALVLYNEKGIALSLDSINELKLSLTQKTASAKNNNMDKKFICLALGIDEASTDTQISLALQNLKNENINLRAENKTLKDAQASVQADKIETMVELAVTQGKITAKQKAGYIKLAQSDFTGVKEILDGLTPVVNLAAASVQPAAPADNGEDRGKWTFNDWSQKDSKGLQLMQNTDKVKFDALFEKQFGTKPTNS